MLYRLLFDLAPRFPAFNVFRYPSFRMVASGIVALVLGMLLGPWFIRELKERQYGLSNVREDTPEQHQKKGGTPTMGGGLILFSVALPTLLLADLTNRSVWMALTVTLGYGAIGLADDYLKVSKKNSKGLAGRLKLFWQAAIFVTAYLLFCTDLHFHQLSGFPFVGVGSHLDSHVYFPFARHLHPDLHWLYLPFALIVVVGTSNGVNLTDGLDGLAIGPTIVSAVTFGALAWVAGSVIAGFNIAHYLYLPHIDGAEELSVFCAALAGSGIAFLWYNAYPATVFMGDVGSLALGGALGTLAVLTKNELLSALIDGLFLVEALSVMIQVASFKATGKRVFRMAPIHHHFELKGWAEPKIIVRFWILSILLSLASLASLKLR
ncbi:MAG: phospho-N-acetylmuramoyl-pentapeptide-transferase [Deltaproteobacteria bacterium]